MELAQRRLTTTKGAKALKLFPIGDIHLGAAACDVDHALRTVEQVRSDPNAYWIGMGDYGDCIMPSDPRWSYRNLDWKRIGRDDHGLPDVGDLAQQQIDMVDDFFKPIWSKCIGLLEGNHEQAFEKHYFANLTKRLAKKHDVPYLSQTALVKLIVSDGLHHTYSPVVFAEHGASGGGTDGNAINNLSQRLAQWNANIYVKGHVHKRGYVKKVDFGWGSTKIESNQRVLGLTGTYLKGYVKGEVTYGEKSGYPPNEMGGLCILISPRSRVIECVNAEALAYI